MARTALAEIYAKLVGDEDARVCRDIEERACRVVPGNFFRQLLALSLTKLGDALSSSKTTLTWLFAAVAAPVWMIGWLVPIREAGSLLPQLFIAAWVRKQPRRKWAWVSGSVVQAVALLVMAMAALRFEGAAAGWVLLLALIVFSLARGLCSVADKDVLGKTVPKTRRGRLSGFAASVSGLIAIGVAVVLLYGFDSQRTDVLAGLLIAAALLWLCAATSYARIREFAGETAGGGNAIAHAISRLSLLRDDVPFRNFVIARALLMVSALSAPFLVLLARDHGADGLAGLPLFIIAAGTASVLSAPFWGRLADLSSRRTMLVSGLVASAVAIAAVLADALFSDNDSLSVSWLFVLLFFCLSVAHDGVRLGRKTYIVDLAGGNRRTDYVAVSNTVMGAILMLTGVVTGVISVFSVPLVLIVLAAMGLTGAWISQRLPEVQQP